MGGSFVAFVVVKGSLSEREHRRQQRFRIMMPVFPAFVLFRCFPAVPLAARGAPAARVETDPDGRRHRAGAGRSSRPRSPSRVSRRSQRSRQPTPRSPRPGHRGLDRDALPANIDFSASDARVRGRTVTLRWSQGQPNGSPVFFRVWRARRDVFSCTTGSGGKLCHVAMPEVGVARTSAFTDRPGSGRWVYRVALAANWLNDPSYGDPYVVSRPLVVTVG